MPSMSLVRGNFYEILTLKPGASSDQIEKAYRLCLALHRETGDDDDTVRASRDRVEQAYAVLHDPERREEYDRLHGFPVVARRVPAEPGVPRPVFAGLREPKPRQAPVPPKPAMPDTLVPRTEGPLETAASGAELKRLRESRGVRLEDIASVTKVSRRILEDIENERHDRLPAPVYVRAFLQQYARLVGLDPRATAEAYLARLPRPR
jgi:curved DNA-binding protein CbpA